MQKRGGASLLSTDSKGLCLRHDNTLYIGENIPEVVEEKSKSPEDNGTPLPLGDGEVVRAERVTTSGEGKKEIPKQVRNDKMLYL